MPHLESSEDLAAEAELEQSDRMEAIRLARKFLRDCITDPSEADSGPQ